MHKSPNRHEQKSKENHSVIIIAPYLVSTPPWLACFCEIQHVLMPVHYEVMACDAEFGTLVVVVPMPCTNNAKINAVQHQCYRH